MVSDAALENAKCAVIRVMDGRGFVVRMTGDVRLVITAAHCLTPCEPPAAYCSVDAAPADYYSIGSLGFEASAECLFCDLVGDIAALGKPGDAEEAVRYVTLTMTASLQISRPRTNQFPARLLSLDGRWLECEARYDGRILRIGKGAEHVRPCMSGSPIITDKGSAVGVVCASAPTACGSSIAHGLPGWLVAKKWRS
jgi:Trypsin-like peptidase domain